MGRRRARGLGIVGSLVVVVLLAPVVAAPVVAAPVVAAPVVAAPVVADRASSSATVAAQAAAAAARVEALALTYRRAAQREREAARRLGTAFVERSRAEQELADAQLRLGEAGAARAASARALYVTGPSGLVDAVLDAGSVDDALWRLSTLGRIRDRTWDRAGRRVDTAADAVARAQAAQRTSAAAGERLVAGLRALQDAAGEAGTALSRARAELRRLSARARRLAAAERAARALAAAQAEAASAHLGGGAVTAALGMPPGYEEAYRAAAATCPGMAWTLLAGVGQVESGHGRNNGPSSAGALGPMQFMPATFAAYGVDGDGDGRADVWNFRDAVFSAAHYLCASGADGTPDGVHRALLAYNHAEWYVDLVLSAQRAIEAAHR